MKHAEAHPSLDVEGCYGCKISSVSFTGVQRLRSERETGQTQADLRKEIYDGARRTGRDIRRAGAVDPTSAGLL